MSTALYISRQLSTLSDSPRLICFFLVWVFVSFPYFWIKETKTFQANEHKLHGSLKQPEHLNTSFHTCSATASFLDCAFSVTVCHGQHPSKATQGSLTSTARVAFAGGTRPSRLPTLKLSWTLRGSCVTHLERIFSPVGPRHQCRTVLPPAERLGGFWWLQGGGTNAPRISRL